MRKISYKTTVDKKSLHDHLLSKEKIATFFQICKPKVFLRIFSYWSKQCRANLSNLWLAKRPQPAIITPWEELQLSSCGLLLFLLSSGLSCGWPNHNLFKTLIQTELQMEPSTLEKSLLLPWSSLWSSWLSSGWSSFWLLISLTVRLISLFLDKIELNTPFCWLF